MPYVLREPFKMLSDLFKVGTQAEMAREIFRRNLKPEKILLNENGETNKNIKTELWI